MNFFLKSDPEKLVRIDPIHKYTHVVIEDGRLITFQKNKADAEAVRNELIRQRQKIINACEEALSLDVLNGSAEANRILKKYGSSARIRAALKGQQRIINSIRVEELIEREIKNENF